MKEVHLRSWVEPLPVIVPPELAAAAGGHQLVAEALVRRGVANAAEARAVLDPKQYSPSPPSALPGMGRAVARINRALKTGEPICVWGDFDVDGQTSTALLVTALRDLGGRVTYHIPLRETEGHGVSLPVLEQIIAGGVRLIVTCDTGISAHDAVAFARSQRVDVVITDHHDLPDHLPDAAAIVNPKLLAAGNGTSPLVDLPGVGVAYKLAEALYERAGRAGEAGKHADLAALGIIADLALLRGDTRYLAQIGLASLREAHRTGVQALLESAELNPANLNEGHVSFVLAPRLNAAGRLADAGRCVELLTTADLTQARIIAADLEALNARRKFLTDRVTYEAEAQLKADRSLLDHAALVLASAYWSAGIIGIVASRLVERYGRPVALISTEPGQSDAGSMVVGRGSARSVEGVDISAAITACQGLLLGFGGHPMAAGFTLDPQRISAFRAALSAQVAAQVAGIPESEGLVIDAVLPLGELSLDLVDDLSRLGPFGPGNPELVLCAPRLEIRADRLVGRQEEHRILTVAGETGFAQQVVWWNGGGEQAPQGLFDLAYAARASTYRGERSVQVEFLAARPSPGAPVVEIAPSDIEVLDFRSTQDVVARLAELRAEGPVTVFGEGELDAVLQCQNRRSLQPAITLAFWTAPSSPSEVRAALAAVRPERVALFAVDPGLDGPEPFLRRLAGLVKHVLKARNGRVAVAELAAATAQREPVIHLGLQWLAAQGSLIVDEESDGARSSGDGARSSGGGVLQLAPGSGQLAPEGVRALAKARLSAALQETAAFRAHFRTAEKDALIRGYLSGSQADPGLTPVFRPQPPS